VKIGCDFLSLAEDRLVKNFISKGKFEGEVEKDLYGNTAGVPFKRSIKSRFFLPKKN